ncbi:hypothetical protein SAMN06265171_105270 [Chryseobacterium rhizoplanae]|uniref:Uncharacterized protein n=1 Tax=Chryseobacterium rhizoplanae TaxID=1609531 RepID=A0A521DM36_9FLAO|nr:hypothetical protein SAMN06265171_105270 [Chryseobacterium rhizoplanae]
MKSNIYFIWYILPMIYRTGYYEDTYSDSCLSILDYKFKKGRMWY